MKALNGPDPDPVAWPAVETQCPKCSGAALEYITDLPAIKQRQIVPKCQALDRRGGLCQLEVRREPLGDSAVLAVPAHQLPREERRELRPHPAPSSTTQGPRAPPGRGGRITQS